jgi:addiction module RelB/DinJ family antitoxin
MTVLLRCRVKKNLLVKANKVSDRLGTTTPEIIRLFLAEVVRTGKVPISLNKEAVDSITCPWAQRAATLGSFYDPIKTW